MPTSDQLKVDLRWLGSESRGANGGSVKLEEQPQPPCKTCGTQFPISNFKVAGISVGVGLGTAKKHLALLPNAGFTGLSGIEILIPLWH